MKVNWKIRFQSRTFLAALFSLILLLAQEVVDLFGLSINLHSEQLTNIFNTFLGIVVLIGIVNDPTVGSLHDSQRSLEKEKLR